MRLDEVRKKFYELGGPMIVEKIDGQPVYREWAHEWAAVTEEMVPYIQDSIDLKEWPWPFRWIAYDRTYKRWYIQKVGTPEVLPCSCGRMVQLRSADDLCSVCNNDE